MAVGPVGVLLDPPVAMREAVPLVVVRLVEPPAVARKAVPFAVVELGRFHSTSAKGRVNSMETVLVAVMSVEAPVVAVEKYPTESLCTCIVSLQRPK